MHWEYAAFDLLVGLPPLVGASRLPGFAPAARRATLLGALPFVAWDIAVVGRHWDFSAAHVLGPRLFGLPLEEWGFFLAVPAACLLLWESLLVPAHVRIVAAARWVYPAAIALLVPAVLAALAGLEYTALVLVALACAVGLDHALGVRLLQQPRGWAYLAAVAALTAVCNGYLTGRPIVIYAPRYQLDVRLGTIPLEDFGFGLALVLAVSVVYQHARGRTPARSWPSALVHARFGGYRHLLVGVDERLPERVEGPVRVAVIGGGLAGLGAAELLSRRGFEVVLFERDARLGGKLAGWRERLDDGFDAPIEHGFHAFFRHYYNLRDWLDEVGVGQRLRPIDDYAILGADGKRHGFAAATGAPGLNLLALAATGMFRLRDVLRPRTGRALETLLRYDAHHEDPALDHTSFATFADAAALPPTLRLVFTTFARAFFADERRISMAELVAAFHFYYLGHDRGLLYDWLDGAYDEALVDPIADLLRGRGVQLRLGTGVETLTPVEGGVVVDGARFDRVVLATDVAAARALVERSPALAPTALARGMAKLHAGQRYAVMRLWCDAELGTALPLFVVTERAQVLDAIAFVHRSDPRTRTWARERKGSVVELHCYAVPDEVADDAIADALLDEAERFVPGLRAALVHRHLQIRADFTALHVGMREHRPTPVTDVPGLVLAGDWVRLPCPAKLMEAAHTSALLAVDAICADYGVRGVPVWTVPLVGLLGPRARPEAAPEPRPLTAR